VRPSRLAPPLAVAAAGLAALAAPAPAGAHLRSGTVAVGLRATVAALPPPLRAALSVRVLASDRALSLTVRPGHAVVVLGYLGKPFLRLDGRGVAANASAPTAVAVGLVPRGAPPGWRLRPGDSAVWHDARVQGVPGAARRAAWSVPLVVDGRRAALRGTIRRLARPSPWPWALLAGLVALAAAAVARRAARPGRAALAFGAVAGGAAVLTAIVFALDAYASPGTWIAGADEVVFAAAGFAALKLGTSRVRLAAVVWLGLLATAVGASKGPVYLDADVLAAVPGVVARLLVTVALAAGVAAAVLGGRCLVERPSPTLHPDARRLPW
jgi:hypothetical protein